MCEVEQRQDVAQSGILAACAKMHFRLLVWGRLIIVGGKGAAQRWDSDTPRKRIEFTPEQVDAAYLLHLMVGQLPEIRQRLVLPEFYRGEEVEVWDGLTPMRRSAIVENMTGSVNKGIRDYALTERRPIPQIRATDFEPIRYRAIRMLVNRESVTFGQQFAGQTTSCGENILAI